MEFITFIWLTLSGIGVIALLLLVLEVRAFRGAARSVRHALHAELLDVQKQLSEQEINRLVLAATEARERLAAMPERRAEGAQEVEQIVDMERLLDESEPDEDVSARTALPSPSLEIRRG